MTECVSTDFLETFGKHQGVHPYWGVIESIVSHATERGGEVEFLQGKGLVKALLPMLSTFSGRIILLRCI